MPEPMPTPAEPPPTANGTHPKGLAGKLEKVRSGIDRLIELSKDMDAIAELKEDATNRHLAAIAAARGALSARGALLDRQAELEDAIKALTSQRDDLTAKLDATTRALANWTAQAEEVRTELTASAVVLAEVEASERERAAAMSKAGDMQTLMAALSRMG